MILWLLPDFRGRNSPEVATLLNLGAAKPRKYATNHKRYSTSGSFALMIVGG